MNRRVNDTQPLCMTLYLRLTTCAYSANIQRRLPHPYLSYTKDNEREVQYITSNKILKLTSDIFPIDITVQKPVLISLPVVSANR